LLTRGSSWIGLMTKLKKIRMISLLKERVAALNAVEQQIASNAQP